MKIEDMVDSQDRREHQDSGERCSVGHFDHEGKRIPACIKCPKCNGWIRPENIHEQCQGGENT